LSREIFKKKRYLCFLRLHVRVFRSPKNPSPQSVLSTQVYVIDEELLLVVVVVLGLRYFPDLQAVQAVKEISQVKHSEEQGMHMLFISRNPSKQFAAQYPVEGVEEVTDAVVLEEELAYR